MSDESTEPAAPALRVVRGDATPEEVAALLVVLQAAAAPAAAAPSPPTKWGAPRRAVRA
ncbi:acyl-CoA carboxylase epsilon subunit, partial [Angustibacter speluncae]